MPSIQDWALAFLLTLAVELAVAVPLLGTGESRARRATGITFAQLASHPAVWFILPRIGWSRLPYLALAESWAIACELVFYRFVFRAAWSRALAISALANGASLAVGTLLR